MTALRPLVVRAGELPTEGVPLPARWSVDERRRWQQVLDQARLSAERRASSTLSADLLGPTTGVARRNAVQESDRGNGLNDRVPDPSTSHKRKSSWTAEERARLQAALDRVHARPLDIELPAIGSWPMAVDEPAQHFSDTAVPLDGRLWTDKQRERVQAALAELRASRLAASWPVLQGATERLSSQSLPDAEVVSAVGDAVLDPRTVTEVAAPAVLPEVSEDTLQPDEFDRLFGSVVPQVDLTQSGPDAPVFVEQIAGSASAQVFSLPKPPAPEHPQWYGPTETIKVHGLLMPGLVSVALKPQPKGVALHPATIAAWMPADLSAPTDGVDTFQDVWSVSYESLTVAQRGLYLRWLASGRTFAVPESLAFLFVRGLESRVVETGPNALADNERRAIALATRDVVARFGHALPQLREHGLNLAGFLDSVDAPARWFLAEVPDLAESFDVPAPLQVAIGQAAREGAALPADWALASVLSDLCVPKRTPVGRCPEEMRELFSIHFETVFPSGLQLQRGSSRTLKVVYRGVRDQRTGLPASASVVVPSADQTWLTQAQVEVLRQTLDRCADELSAYSRFIGRQLTPKGTPDAEVRLPRSLLQRRLAANFQALSEGSDGSNEVSLDQAWMALWGKLPERKDSAPFLRALLEAAGFSVVTIPPAHIQSAGEPKPAVQPFRLDPEKLEKVRQDDAAATKLLSALFADTSEVPPTALPPAVHGDPARTLFPQLDDDHFNLLTSLLSEDSWNRERLQVVTSHLGLMIDGALEVINDAAFELAGVALVVDDGDLQVDPAVSCEMKAAMAASRNTEAVPGTEGES